eukprot:gene1941-1179_t
MSGGCGLFTHHTQVCPFKRGRHAGEWARNIPTTGEYIHLSPSQSKFIYLFSPKIFLFSLQRIATRSSFAS